VGRRLFLAAGEMIYGNISGTGPRYKSMLVSEGKCRLRFSDTGEGLVLLNTTQSPAFLVAGTDRKFHPAQTLISGNEVVIWNPEIQFPVAVRYAWANQPGSAGLYNTLNGKAFLPASPFRTDDWPGLTVNRF
jgi:sialate O-acetylesterase